MDHRHTRPYVVKPGDTMYMIARQYNIPLDVLIAANPQIQNPDLIYPGQVIMIPMHHHHHHHDHHHCRPCPKPVPESPYPCLPSRRPRFRTGFMEPQPMPGPTPGQYPGWWMNPGQQPIDDWYTNPQNPYDWDYDWENPCNKKKRC